MLFHGNPTATKAAFLLGVRAVLTEMADVVWQGTSFNGAEYAAVGSSFFFPETWSAINSTLSSTPGAANSPAVAVQWGGRGNDGVRVKLYLFEVAQTIDANMRLNAGDVAAFDGVTAALNSNGATIRTKSGSQAAWKSYINIVVNDFLTRKARS